MPTNPCGDCPFRAKNAGTMDPMSVEQMEDNSRYIEGFPCHKLNPSSDIMTCPTAAENANDCAGYKLMRENLTSNMTPHPEIVGCFDELMKG